MEAGSNGQYSKSAVTARIRQIKRQQKFPEESFEAKMLTVLRTMEDESWLKKEVKAVSAELHQKTRHLILNMDMETALMVLEKKWITPIINNLGELPEDFINSMIRKLVVLEKKYRLTFADVGNSISTLESKVSDIAGKLEGNEFDMKGIEEFRYLMKGIK